MELNEKEINEIVENIRKDYFYFSEIPDEIKIKYNIIINKNGNRLSGFHSPF